MIKILYFARFREQLGLGEERLEIGGKPCTAADLIEHLRARGGVWSEVLGEGERVLIAVNQDLARPQTALQDGDEVAFFPPVTGG